MNAGNNNAALYFKSKTTSLLILAATALVCSRVLFFVFNDPEGPNLVVVTGLALVVYLLSLAVYLLSPLKITGVRRLAAVIGIQVLSVIVLYFFVK
jgi:hypothetical protein